MQLFHHILASTINNNNVQEVWPCITGTNLRTRGHASEHVRVHTHTHSTTKILLIGNLYYLRKKKYQDIRSLLGGIKKT